MPGHVGVHLKGYGGSVIMVAGGAYDRQWILPDVPGEQLKEFPGIPIQPLDVFHEKDNGFPAAFSLEEGLQGKECIRNLSLGSRRA